jgi:coenzyme F420-reducing hydrogenase alpha subunit
MGDNQAMAFDPGRVRLSLVVEGGVVGRAEVACERPAVARLLRGKPAEQAVALIYSLCGKAQGIAARAALAVARGQPVEPHVDAEALAEAVREHAWKLFVDWPRQLGLDPDEAFFVRLARASRAEGEELAAALRAHPLPAALRGVLDSDAIDGLLRGRIEARLAQVLDWLAGRPQGLGTVSATGVAAGIGAASVETARGTLRHRLELDGDRIADYAITAPTDVHFAAAGDAARWLEGLRGMPAAEAERQATRLVMAFDPCVPWELAGQAG